MEAQLSDVEELTLCNFCKQKFNDTDLCPKILPCKHYFCLKCIESTMVKGRELYCVHCWKRTELTDPDASLLQTHAPILSLANHLLSLKCNNYNSTDKTGDKEKKTTVTNENCPIHGVPLTMWCHTCHQALCTVCMVRCDHPGHQIKKQNEAKEQLINEVQLELMSMNKILVDIQKLTSLQKEFLLKVLEACITLKTYVESDIQMGNSTPPEMVEIREILIKAKAGLLNLDTPLGAQNIFTNLLCEKQRLEHKYNELLLQCKLDDLIGNSGVVFDFALITQLLTNLQHGEIVVPRRNVTVNNPLLFLTNYCMSQLYSKYVLTKGPELQNEIRTNLNEDVRNNVDALMKTEFFHPISKQKQKLEAVNMHSPPIARNFPLYFFNIDVNNTFLGRIVIETRPDVAPKMSKNFGALCTGETGVSYKNCCIFQCWENESIITGDFEMNNGRGGHSIYDEAFFMPDETKIPAVRGAVGMRRTQKRHDNLGMVGSQFRVILQEMRGFSAIFGQVVEGLEVIEKIASCGDQTGKPTKSIVITSCGRL